MEGFSQGRLSGTSFPVPVKYPPMELGSYLLVFQNLDGHVSDSWEGVRLHAVTTLGDNKTILAADTHKRVRSYNFDNTTDKTV